MWQEYGTTESSLPIAEASMAMSKGEIIQALTGKVVTGPRSFSKLPAEWGLKIVSPKS